MKPRKQQKLDTETDELETRQSKIADLVKHEGWGIVREIFTNKLLDLQSVLNIVDFSNIAIEVSARKMAIEYLTDFMRQVEGVAHQYESNKEKDKDGSVSPFVVRIR